MDSSLYCTHVVERKFFVHHFPANLCAFWKEEKEEGRSIERCGSIGRRQ